MTRRLLTLVVACFACATAPASAGQNDRDTPHDIVAHPAEPAITYHTATIDGETVHYQATAGTITLATDTLDPEPRARMFYIAYRRTLLAPGDIEERLDELRTQALEEDEDADLDGIEIPGDELFPPAHERTLSFSFNGGPGSSSVWLHLGVFGPKRTAYTDEAGNPGPPPYRVVPNEHSLLHVSDFVFIDPISTGFSRPEAETSAKEFHGLEQDIASVAEFIKRYITRTERWSSPIFVAGESYGTTRAAALSEHLHNSHGISVNGVILVSTVLDFATIRFNSGHDLPYISFLPTYAATAQHHGVLSDELQALTPDELYAEARDFALGEYASALMMGTALDDETLNRVAARMSELTGLSQDYIRRANLRVSQGRFSKELLRDRGLTVGRFDSRFTGRDIDGVGEVYEYDPSYAAIRANFTASFNAYIREELGFESDLSYEILTNVWPWDFGSAGNGRFVNVAERLRKVMHQQPHILVFNAAGYHDLATPPLGADYTLDHMQLAPELRGNITRTYYYGGHMMYLMEDSLAKMQEDLVAFYRAATPR
ncbi:MAG: S10 family peptidase [Phycisphaerales bacterium]